jgi:DNA helicase-2/ATP-dependent DNA helicase PcrA
MMYFFLKPGKTLEGFSAAQTAIITEEKACKQVVAAAGSGKTRTVIGLTRHRFDSGLERPGRFLILSFSRKACGEIRSRLPSYLHDAVEIRTFHSFCYRRLLELHPTLSRSSFRILEEEERNRFLYAILREHPDVIGGIPFSLVLKSRETFYRHFPDLAMKAYRALHAYKRENHLLEYDDLIQILLWGLRRQESWALHIKSLYDMILVDEFQDTDPQQLEFLLLIHAPRLMVVGDDWQAIYSFRGATVQPFLDFKKLFPKTVIYPLAENYRSLQPIVRGGSGIIKHSSRQIRKKVKAVRGRGPDFPVSSFAVRPGEEPDFVSLIENYDAVILTRSNFRRDLWIASGFPEDRILTIHRSKGLEFPVVLLDVIGGWSGETFLTDEEIRIAYVGMTRAENLFFCLHRPVYPEHAMERTVFEVLFRPICRPQSRDGLIALLEQEIIFRHHGA